MIQPFSKFAHILYTNLYLKLYFTQRQNLFDLYIRMFCNVVVRDWDRFYENGASAYTVRQSTFSWKAKIIFNQCFAPQNYHNHTHTTILFLRSIQYPGGNIFGQVLDLLVPVRSIHYCTFTSGLFTMWSSWGLTYSHSGISHLKGGFTLRCFQRLSLPDLATRLCHWYDNRYTIGPSIPVLSY